MFFRSLWTKDEYRNKSMKAQRKEASWFHWLMIILFVLAIGGTGSCWYVWTHSLYAARNWGGSLTIAVPQGGEHISTAWKGGELWTETYFPAENKCVYQQQSQYGLVEGSVIIQPCNYRSSK
jgi:hypothetical protein